LKMGLPLLSGPPGGSLKSSSLVGGRGSGLFGGGSLGEVGVRVVDWSVGFERDWRTATSRWYFLSAAGQYLVNNSIALEVICW